MMGYIVGATVGTSVTAPRQLRKVCREKLQKKFVGPT